MNWKKEEKICFYGIKCFSVQGKGKSFFIFCGSTKEWKKWQTQSDSEEFFRSLRHKSQMSSSSVNGVSRRISNKTQEFFLQKFHLNFLTTISTTFFCVHSLGIFNNQLENSVGKYFAFFHLKTISNFSWSRSCLYDM